MKIISLIPARFGSKGLPEKNIKLLNGHPLIAYSIAVSKILNIDSYLSSNSDEYLEIGKKYGANILKRPDEISKDESSDLDYLLHTITELKLSQDDLIILLRPTTPIRNPKVVEKAISYFNLYSSSKSCLRSIHELTESPEKYVKIEKNLIKPFIGKDLKSTNDRRQNFEKVYHPNGYVDIIKVSQISSGDQYGKTQFPYVTEVVPEIDTIEDFEYCEWKMSKGHILIDYLKGI